MRKDIKNEVDRQKLNQMMGEKFKQEKKAPSIRVERNLPKGVDSEWGRMIKRGEIKKAHLDF